MAAEAKFFEFESTLDVVSTIIPVRMIGFTPTGVFIWSVGLTGAANAYAGGHIRNSIGFASGFAAGDMAVLGGWHKDGLATAETRVFAEEDNVALVIDADAVDGSLALDAFDPDGFDLIVTRQASITRRFYGIAFGGDIDCGVANRKLPLVDGNFDITGFGFGAASPEAGLFLHLGDDGALPISKSRSEVNFGMAAASPQAAMLGEADRDNVATTEATTYCIGGECCARTKTSGAIDQRMSPVSFAADKITLALADSNDADWLFAMALKGGDFAIKEFLTSITAPADIPITGLASRPAAGIVISGFRAEDAVDSASSDSRWSVGGFSEAGAPIEQGAQAAQSLTGKATSQTSRGQERPSVYVSANVGADTKKGAIRVKSIEPTGLTLEQAVADAAPRFGAVLTIGPGTAAPTPPTPGEGKVVDPTLVTSPTLVT